MSSSSHNITNTNWFIFNNEKLPRELSLSAMVTTTSAASSDIPATGSVCVASDEFEALVTVPTSSAKVTEETAESSKMKVAAPQATIVEEKVEQKMTPVVVAVTPPAAPPTVATPIAATKEQIVEATDKEATITALVIQENGEVPLTSEATSSPTSPTPFSISAHQGNGEANSFQLHLFY